MFRRLVVAMLVAVSIIGVAPMSSGHHYTAIQPGVQRPEGHSPGQPGNPVCTYNFIFSDQRGRRYIGIAGHCTGFDTTEVGQVMHVTDVGRIGTVVWKAPLPKDREAFPLRDGDTGSCGALRPEGADYCTDFALVAIDRALYGHIDPAVRHWGGPTGFVPREEIEAGMTMYHYGYGAGLHAHEMTRPRAGVVLGTVTGGCGYRAAFPFSGGDSGSPQIAGDGRALGLATASEGDGAVGMSVDCVLDAAAKAGYRLKLETAPLTDAVEREKDRLQRAGGPDL